MLHDLFRDMGVIQYPMYIATVFMVVQIARSALQMRRPGAGSGQSSHTILIWGFLNPLLGILGTVLGLVLAGKSIESAGAGRAEPTLVAGGLKVSLYSQILGLLLLTFAVVAWLVLQMLQPHGQVERRAQVEAAG